MLAKKIIIKGKVQGVGFRPFVYKLAIKYNIKGYVLNDSRGVEIFAQGTPKDINAFETQLRKKPPPISKIISIKSKITSPDQALKGFLIKQSKGSISHEVLISPDIATCPDCLRELFDPEDRRYLFPFINCTNCGPRFTITSSIPYDRKNTSMSCFSMCDNCYREYTNPLDRRFHAQPNCCPECGPKLHLLNNAEKLIAQGTNAIDYAARELADGNIIALKGLGGFHICCAADNEQVVKRLRELKHRPYKPFALMADSIKDIEEIAYVSKEEKEILKGEIRPIVLLRARPNVLPKSIAPDTSDYGIMLPYTPIHHLLFYFYKKYIPQDKFPILVMTSGNRSGNPICIGNREAISNLKEFVSYFLIHNRDILIRCDDSVVRVLGKKGFLFYRRARGFVPSPVFLKHKFPTVMGVGAELKNTVCFIKNDQAFVSQYIGDLKNLDTYNFFLNTIDHYIDILKIAPKAIGADMHPDYLSTRYAKEQDKLPVIRVQHHHSHILSVMAENQIDEEVIGIALDGSGLGPDNTIWGGEILLINKDLSFQRTGYLSPIRLPGGEIAIKEIWRIGLSFLYSIGEDNIERFLTKVPIRKKELIYDMLKKDINCIITTSCGRLFDAVCSLIGLRSSITYEGEGAIVLESIQDKGCDIAYEIPIKNKEDKYIINTQYLIKEIIKDLIKNIPPSIISRKFHLGLCEALAETVKNISKDTGIKKIALSGGVFQNQTILGQMIHKLTSIGLTPIFHRSISPNDESISLGQAYFVANKIK